MVFSEPFFLFVFLPLALAAILASVGRGHSGVILAFSFVFYYWASGWLTLLILFSVIFNWAMGKAVARARTRWPLWIGVGVNLGLLVFFKYTLFLTGTFDRLTGLAASDPFLWVILPVGISFFTFQGVSYLVDVHRKDAEPERDLIRFGAYLSFFPQLIAGPIVRFRDVIEDYRAPKISLENASGGALRFAHGLAKKVIIADGAGAVADACFGLPAGELTFAAAWLGALAYAVQIYFDFSGYSDMAIGLGRICGIRFLENFRHPYASSTVTEFWRRWHVSLSTWFRDYLYIPLGGSRGGEARTYANLFIVFVATGLWHGAAFTFLFWGLYHGAFLVAERVLFRGEAAKRMALWMRAFYLLPVVVLGWVLFRADSLGGAVHYYQSMASIFASGAFALPVVVEGALTPYTVLALGLGALSFVVPREPSLGVALFEADGRPRLAAAAYGGGVLVLASAAALAADFSPFLYFRF